MQKDSEIERRRPLAGVQKTEELKLGEWVCEILNAQLVPAIVAWNFGRVEGIELPEIRCAMPDAQMNMAKIEYYKALKELGAEIPKAKFYDDLGIPVPEKGTETMGWEKGDTPPDGGGTPFGGNTPQGGGKPPVQVQQDGKDGNAPQNTRDRKDGKDENTEAARNSGGKKPVAEMTDEELEAELTELERKRQARLDAELKEAEDMADDVYAEWLAPATEWLQKAAEGKVTQAEFRKALEEGKIQLNTRVLADALYEAAAKPLRRARGEQVSAKRRKNSKANVSTSVKVSGKCPKHEKGLPCKRHDKKPTATPSDSNTAEYIIGESYEKPRTTPLELDSAPASIRPNDWAAQIGAGLSIKTPLQECSLSTDIESRDWAKYGDGEIEWRKRNLNYAIRTLENPQEVWQGYKGNMVYISKFKGEQDRVVIVVTHGNEVITYYAEKKRPEKMNKYRKGKFLHERKKAQR